jgi:Rieske Fe-S protein
MADENQPKDTPEGLQKPIGRRDFVKSSVVVAAGGAIVAGAVPYVVPLSYNPRKIPRFPYVGARILPPGPAPQGIPLIPVLVNKDGLLEGVPENRKSKVKHDLSWYKYCSHEAAPGLDISFTQDNKLRYYTNPEKVSVARAQGLALWYENLLDQELRADHFKKIGDGAPFRWRSEGQVGTNIVTGIIIKVDPSKIKGSLPDGFVWDNKDGSGFIAVCSFCAHFCCVPGYLENNSPKTHEPGKGVNDTVIYCSCHDSRYDFTDIRQYTFPPDF